VEIFVDDDPRREAFADADTLHQVLLHIQAEMCAPGDVVVSIRCDGQDVPSGDMAAVLRQPASSIERLEVFTGTRHQLVLDAMDQAAACLSDTDTECQRVAGMLNEGNVVEAAEALGRCLGVWQQVHDAVAKSFEMLQLNADRTKIRERPLVELMSKPKEVLVQVRDALQVRDYVMLADILQYEFHDVTTQWHEIITILRTEAQRLTSGQDAP
jgi:hypothetical protein